MLAPILALLFIGTAISSAPWFSWSENCLSDLAGMAGETPLWAARGTPSVLFNTGLIISGILAIIATIGIKKSGLLDTQLSRTGSILLILATIALLAIGLLPEIVGAPHFYASTAFFFLAPLSVLILGAGLRKSDRRLGWLAIILGALGLYSISIPLIKDGCAINETIAIIPLALFILIFGARMLKQ